MSNNPYLDDGIVFYPVEGFDYWNVGNPPVPWEGNYSGVQAHTHPTLGRRGGGCAYFHPGASLMNWSLRHTFGWGTTQTWNTSGFALAVGTASQQYCTRGLYLMSHWFYAGALGLKTGTGGAIEVWNRINFALSGQTKIAQTAAGVLTGNGTYDYIEFYTHRSSAQGAGDGTWQVWVNEVKVLEGTMELWTDNSNGTILQYGVWGHDATDVDTNVLIDDLYPIGGTEASVRRVLGDTQVRASWPKTPDAGSVGDNSWLLGAGTDKTSSQVDSHTDNDGDTTYIYTPNGTIGAKQSWEMDLPLINTSTPSRDYAYLQVHSTLKAQGSAGPSGTIEHYVTNGGYTSYSSNANAQSSGATILTHYDWSSTVASYQNDPGVTATNTLFDDTTFHLAKWGVMLNGLTGTEMRMSAFVVQVCLPKSMVAAPTRRSYVTQI